MKVKEMKVFESIYTYIRTHIDRMLVVKMFSFLFLFQCKCISLCNDLEGRLAGPLLLFSLPASLLLSLSQLSPLFTYTDRYQCQVILEKIRIIY